MGGMSFTEWTGVEPDGWVADYRIVAQIARFPIRVHGRWAWPGDRFHALYARYRMTGQPVERPLDWAGRDAGCWRRVRTAPTAWALRA